MFTGKHICRSFFLNKVSCAITYFHFWFSKLFLKKQPVTSDFQSNCSEKYSKSNRKTSLMEFFLSEVEDYKFTIKGLSGGALF